MQFASFNEISQCVCQDAHVVGSLTDLGRLRRIGYEAAKKALAEWEAEGVSTEQRVTIVQYGTLLMRFFRSGSSSWLRGGKPFSLQEDGSKGPTQQRLAGFKVCDASLCNLHHAHYAHALINTRSAKQALIRGLCL